MLTIGGKPASGARGGVAAWSALRRTREMTGRDEVLVATPATSESLPLSSFDGGGNGVYGAHEVQLEGRENSTQRGGAAAVAAGQAARAGAAAGQMLRRLRPKVLGSGASKRAAGSGMDWADMHDDAAGEGVDCETHVG